jgi:vacuolar protein sorting-associated protein 53
VLQMAAIDVEVLEILRGQHDVAMQSHQDLAQATEEIADLHRTMRTILEQASMTQQKVDVICKDIRAMDNAKRNLTQSITILENFGTLTDALADLKETGSDRCAAFCFRNGVAIYVLPGQPAFCGMLMRACWR